MLFTLSKPAASNLLPKTSPIPAKSVTGLSPIGSATKLRCFCDVDIFIYKNKKLALVLHVYLSHNLEIAERSSVQRSILWRNILRETF